MLVIYTSGSELIESKIIQNIICNIFYRSNSKNYIKGDSSFHKLYHKLFLKYTKKDVTKICSSFSPGNKEMREYNALSFLTFHLFIDLPDLFKYLEKLYCRSRTYRINFSLKELWNWMIFGDVKEINFQQKRSEIDSFFCWEHSIQILIMHIGCTVLLVIENRVHVNVLKNLGLF